MISSQVTIKRMTQSKKANNFFHNYSREFKNEAYLKINLIFAGVILLIIAYSGIFSPDNNNYPVICLHEKLTGVPCFSCGLSHSFSLIVRSRISEAYQWNVYGIRVFLFFASQLLMRMFFSVYYVKNVYDRNWLIWYDITGSIIIFTIAFYPFFRQLVINLI
jgi:hypothetical protein